MFQGKLLRNGNREKLYRISKALAELYGVALDDLVNNLDGTEVAGVKPKGKRMFGLVKVGERGQIVIPKKAREIFNICPGDSLL